MNQDTVEFHLDCEAARMACLIRAWIIFRQLGRLTYPR